MYGMQLVAGDSSGISNIWYIIYIAITAANLRRIDRTKFSIIAGLNLFPDFDSCLAQPL